MDYEYYRYKMQYVLTDKQKERETTISTAKKTDSTADKTSEVFDVSGHQRTLNLSALYKFLEEKKWQYCIWISKLDRDHNIQIRGQLDSTKVLFKKLVTGFGLTFKNKNGWETPVRNDPDKKQYTFTMSIHKNGHVRLWIGQYMSEELFFKDLIEVMKPCKLTPEEFQEFVNSYKDSNSRQMFYLETANLIGPREIIEKEFNKACLIYQNVYYKGLYHPVLVKIDKSKGPFEIEFIGPEEPTRRLQDVTVRPFEVVQSLGELEYRLDSNIELSMYSLEQNRENKLELINIQNSLGSVTQLIEKSSISKETETEDKPVGTNIEKQLTDINEAIKDFAKTKEDVNGDSEKIVSNLKELAESVKELAESAKEVPEKIQKTIEELAEMQKNFENRMTTSETTIKEEFHNNTEEVILQFGDIEKKIKTEIENATKDINKNNTDLKTEITQVSADLRNIDKKIDDTFNKAMDELKKEFRTSLYNNLYLITRQLQLVPEQTAREIEKLLNVSKKSLYHYLNILQTKKIITSKTKKSKKPGRPIKIFSILKR
jgi:predicted  nucleic acid-binding Zn-ribbon protein